MKKVFYSFALLLLIASCGDAVTEKTMTVSGKVDGLKKGVLYLQHMSDSTLIAVDSLEVNGDGSFSFQTEMESPEIYYLYLNKKDNNEINDRIRFFGEPGTITINTAWNTFDSKAKISGSETHKKLEEFQKHMSKINKRNFELLQESVGKDSLYLDSLQRQSDRNTQRGYLFAINYAINNKDSYVAPYIAISEIANANVKYLDSINNSLTPEVADSKYGRLLKEHIALVKK